MQLAVRDDRPNRPEHLAVCAATATAVVRLLADPRAVDGPWTPFVRHWEDGRIRKVVRRGRGAPFAATGALDHVEVACDGAVVRAFVPGPTDAVPRELAKLQVGGTDMPRTRSADGTPAPGGDPATRRGPAPGGLPAAGSATAGVSAAGDQDPDGLRLTVALNPTAAMTTGKAAAQAGHAAQLAWISLQPPELAPVLDRWRAGGFAVRVVVPGPDEWRRLVRSAPVAVRDAGFTEVAPGTLTAVALWPG